jgi:GntR family transcriptional regulator/MocR family aminotransferase
VIPVPVEKDGINPDHLDRTPAKAVYVTPSHQFPTGVVLPVNKRLGLIEWADRNDAYIIEDDYDSELRYNSRPISSLQSLDMKGRVVYLNTFSKALAPGLRMSFMVLPLSLLEEYQLRFSRYNCSVPWLEQKALYEFMKEGHWSRHLRRINVLNKRRHDVLINAIMEKMGKQVVIYGKNAGLHIIIEVKNGMSEKELIEAADSVGVTVYPLSNYYADQRNNTGVKVLIGFSGLSEEEILKGIDLLKSIWF